MASKNSTQRGASASSRRSGTRSRSGGRSTARTRERKAPARQTRSAQASRRPAASRVRAARPQRPRWLMPAIVVTVVFAVAWSFYSPLKLHYVEAREQHRLEVQLAELKERNQTLRAEVERLKTPEGVEELARTSLGLVKDGENLYVVVDDAEESATAGPAVDAGALDEETPLWQTVLDLVFGVR